MANFKAFSEAVEAQFNIMKQHNLFEVDVDKDELFTLYLSSFPEGTDPLYKERTEHTCNCCKNFIRDVGNTVAIIDDVIVSIWDVIAPDFYQDVASALAAFVRTKRIKQPLSTHQGAVGTKNSQQLLADNSVKVWNHFYAKVPTQNISIEGSVLSDIVSTIQVGTRGFEEIQPGVVDVLLELIAQNSIYRGEEHLSVLQNFKQLQTAYLKLQSDVEKDIFIWTSFKKPGFRIRNSVIGTLLTDLSDGVDLEVAVKSFEVKVAPTNYKRPTALITKGMIDQAMKTIQDEGIESALKRRFATPEDISINNVLFVDRTTAKVMKDADSLQNLLMTEVKTTKDFSKVEKISIDDFITKVLPTTQSLEVMVENRHKANLVSLIAPTDADAPNILKWNNNFTWSYSGGVTDSMKERVKSFGGNVEGVLRFSIQWNTENDNLNDLDAHCNEPKGGHIYYGKKQSPFSGTLDVDIMNPSGKPAVENIIYTDINKMPDGDYTFSVNTYANRNGRNFSAEIEFNGTIYEFFHEGACSRDTKVATVTKKGNEFTITPYMPTTTTSKNLWSIKTQEFEPVNMVTLSPNYWDDQTIGNKHYFFMLKDCINEEQPRGFYNEFLNAKYDKHRKVFEVLATKTKPEIVDHQLSGIGFSSTKRDNLIVKVHGTVTRVLDIQF